MSFMPPEWYAQRIQECRKALATARFPEPFRERIQLYSELMAKAEGQRTLKETT